MGEEVPLDFTGNPEGALQALQKIIDKKNQVIKEMRSGTKAYTDDFTKGLGQVANKFAGVRNIALGVLSAFGLSGGIQGVINGIVGKVKEWYEWQAKIGEEAGKTASKLLPLAMMQTPGKERQRMRQIALEGAGVVSTEEGAKIMQEIQGKEPDFKQAMQKYGNVLELKRAGYETKEALAAAERYRKAKASPVPTQAMWEIEGIGAPDIEAIRKRRLEVEERVPQIKREREFQEAKAKGEIERTFSTIGEAALKKRAIGARRLEYLRKMGVSTKGMEERGYATEWEETWESLMGGAPRAVKPKGGWEEEWELPPPSRLKSFLSHITPPALIGKTNRAALIHGRAQLSESAQAQLDALDNAANAMNKSADAMNKSADAMTNSAATHRNAISGNPAPGLGMNAGGE